MSGQTSWEFSRRDELNFRKIYPLGFEPFNEGICNNIKSVFCHNNKPRDWDLPTVEKAEGMKYFNIWENEYWSCC